MGLLNVCLLLEKCCNEHTHRARCTLLAAKESERRRSDCGSRCVSKREIDAGTAAPGSVHLCSATRSDGAVDPNSDQTWSREKVRAVQTLRVLHNPWSEPRRLSNVPLLPRRYCECDGSIDPQQLARTQVRLMDVPSDVILYPPSTLQVCTGRSRKDRPYGLFCPPA